MNEWANEAIVSISKVESGPVHVNTLSAVVWEQAQLQTRQTNFNILMSNENFFFVFYFFTMWILELKVKKAVVCFQTLKVSLWPKWLRNLILLCERECKIIEFKSQYSKIKASVLSP